MEGMEKIFGSRSWYTDWAQRGLCVMTESQIFQPDKSYSISILSHDRLELKILKIWFNLSRTRYTGARGRIIKNIRQLKNFFCVFSSQSKNITIHRKTQLCFYPFFPSSFCKKAVWVRAEWLFPERLTSIRPVVHISAFTMIFYGIARARLGGSYGNYQLFTEVEVNSGGYLARCFAARWISTTCKN